MYTGNKTAEFHKKTFFNALNGNKSVDSVWCVFGLIRQEAQDSNRAGDKVTSRVNEQLFADFNIDFEALISHSCLR